MAFLFLGPMHDIEEVWNGEDYCISALDLLQGTSRKVFGNGLTKSTVELACLICVVATHKIFDVVPSLRCDGPKGEPFSLKIRFSSIVCWACDFTLFCSLTT